MQRYKVKQKEIWLTERIIEASSEDDARRQATALEGDAGLIESRGLAEAPSLSSVRRVTDRYFRVYAYAQVGFSIIVQAEDEIDAHKIARVISSDEWEQDDEVPGTWKVRLPDFVEEVDESEIDWEEEEESEADDEEEEEESGYDEAVARNCIAAVDEIYEILWPGGDSNHQWGSQTLHDIADALRASGIEAPEGE